MKHEIPIELEVLAMLKQCGCTDTNDINTILEFLDSKNVVVTIEAVTREDKRTMTPTFCYYVETEYSFYNSVSWSFKQTLTEPFLREYKYKTRQDAYSAGINFAVRNNYKLLKPKSDGNNDI